MVSSKNKNSAHYLGYEFLNHSGKVECLTIYTGLQLGFGMFLDIAAFQYRMHYTALLFCVCLYLRIMLTRTSAALYWGELNKTTFQVSALEYVPGIWGAALLLFAKKN